MYTLTQAEAEAEAELYRSIMTLFTIEERKFCR